MSLGDTDEMARHGQFDCIVIGAGIAGASVAAELAPHMRTALIERESQPGYHTTGRSAALYTVAYGPPVIRALTRASGPFFHAADSPHLTAPLLRERGALFVARADQLDAMRALQDDLGDAVTPVEAAEVEKAIPLLRRGYVAAGLTDASARDIDVHALHQHYLRSFKAADGVLLTNADVTALRRGPEWTVQTAAGEVSAPIVVNAAGAWADEIAALAGIARRGLVPKRRTALIVAAPPGVAIDGWPMIVDMAEEFYVKPDAGKLLISPADEEPSPPCDAQPDEYQVALCIDRVERAFDMKVARIESKWAGLRSFLPNGCPLASYETGSPGFFWLAGQGGYGIQTAPALARAAAALVQGKAIPDDIAEQGVTSGSLAGDRQGSAS